MQDRARLPRPSRHRRAGVPFAATAHGDPTRQHGYAVTVHVAQGGTVDRTYTLGHELSREAGYTALSRGRDANHLYVANEPPAREEFAPAEQVRPDAVERLVSDLQRALLSRWRSTFTMTAGLGGWTNDSARSTQRREAMLWRGRRPAWEFLSGHSRTTSGSTGERLTPPRAHDRRPVAELLQMRRSTLEDYARRGLLLSLKPGRHRRFVRSDVEAALGRLRADGASGD